MGNQKQITRISMYVAIGSFVLAVLVPAFFRDASDTAGTIALTVYLLGLLAALVASTVVWATWKESTRKPGATPLIYSVIALPVGVLAFFLLALAIEPFIGMYGLLLALTGATALIVGVVKKLAAPASVQSVE